ncbi:MAG: hypothetical protein EOP84_14280, partial [Verrucomicrobiaceae bacterium]
IEHAVFVSGTALAASTPGDPAADRAALLNEVEQIGVPGVPGGLSVFGPQAFAVVGGKNGKESLLPVVAAAQLDKGRIVGFGHDGYLALTESGTGTLLVNAARWAAGGAKGKVKVAVRRLDKLATHLEAAGFQVEKLSGADWTRQLTGKDVLCIEAHTLTEKDVAPLSRWIRSGGGLITATTGWGWVQTHPGKSLTGDFPGNQILAPAGLVFSGETPDRTAPEGYLADNRDLSLLNASAALDAILASTPQQPAPKATLTQASTTLTDALRAVPADDKILLPRMTALASRPEAAVLPAPDKPLKQDQGLARLLLARNLQLLREAAPEQLRAHPAAEAFPGAVSADAPRVKNRIITVDTKVPAWHSTGLYAPPGGLISVQIPADAAKAGLSIRIGCHSDSLWHLNEWKRAPEITRTAKITSATSTIANSFGGLVYIDVPKGCKLGSLQITINGAVEAPHFVLGKTRPEEWLARIRNAPAPWAELETKNIILSVPSTAIRNLEDPEALMRFWDDVMNAIADLAAIPRERERAERIVADVQISAGYMHSGYPIMTHLDAGAVERSLSLAQMKQGSWGHFHEIGHNHQVGDWTFSGTGEVTCNLFALYCCETLCALPPGSGHDAMDPRRVEERLKKHLATRANFQRWKDDPFLALTMYHQLRMGFGWDTYRKVFAEYQTLTKAERPKNDDEKRDQWMVRFSRTVGKNLGPFFEAWGVPTSENARASIKNLPEWMPADWPRM